MRIPLAQITEVLQALFLQHDFSEENATLLARTHAESSLSGVASHGLNRVPIFIDYVKQGLVKVNALAEKVEGMGSMERWDGNLGSGVLNATSCTNRAIELAKEQGISLVALRNTNHWMRGGTYGRQAAAAGCMAIMFTNTIPNMPPWGGKDSRLGNNPLIIAIPRKEGDVVLDMAMTQFSFGKVHNYHLRGEQLPFAGGWDEDGQLTTDPGKILANERGLPIGYWKGSALSMVLDMLATLLSAGNSSFRIGQKKWETAISQVFLCIDAEKYGDGELQNQLLNEIIRYSHDVERMAEDGQVYFPGERSAMTRAHNLEEGVPVDPTVWQQVLDLLRA